MARRIEDIDARIADLRKLDEISQSRERRINEVAAKVYADDEKKGQVAGLAELFESAGVRPESMEQFFQAQARAANVIVERATPLLQLTEEEISVIAHHERAIRLIDPCLWVHNSPGWECVYYAASCNSNQNVTADASASCQCELSKNELNPQVTAQGVGAMGLRWANLDCWCDFDIPARPTHANVDVWSKVATHGFYVLNSGTQWARFTLDLEMTAYQYGVAWATDTVRVVDETGTGMGRFDDDPSLHVMIPAGADPFQVRVSAKLRARAKGGGAIARGDFGTGNGNYLDIFWVNTLSA